MLEKNIYCSYNKRLGGEKKTGCTKTIHTIFLILIYNYTLLV